MKPAAVQRFWANVDKRSPTECWPWLGGIDRSGYGRFSYLDTRPGAHRVAWELANGKIPGDLTIDHQCFVTNCVNPAHLRLMTLAENSRNQRSKYATHCVHGHEFTPANTYRSPDRTSRTCRACNAIRSQRYKAKRRLEAVA